MDTMLITTLLTTALNTLTTVLALVDKTPALHDVSQKLVAAIASITKGLNILTLPN